MSAASNGGGVSGTPSEPPLHECHVIRKTPAGNNTTRRKHTTTERGRRAMGIDWMTRDELSEAIPPAYTEFIGRQLLNQIRVAQFYEDEPGLAALHGKGKHGL